MAAARPLVVGPEIFADIVGAARLPLVSTGEPHDLSARLTDVAQATPDALEATGRQLRSHIERNHSMTSWVDAIAALATELHAARPRA
jgi:hypothetical protein